MHTCRLNCTDVIFGRRSQVERYQQLLRPWAAQHMDYVIRIQPEMVTGIQLVPGKPD